MAVKHDIPTAKGLIDAPVSATDRADTCMQRSLGTGEETLPESQEK